MAVLVGSANSRSSTQDERLKLNLLKLKALLDYTSEFGVDNSTGGLLKRFNKILQEDLDINRILYYFRVEEGWRLLLNVNCAARKRAASLCTLG